MEVFETCVFGNMLETSVSFLVFFCLFLLMELSVKMVFEMPVGFLAVISDLLDPNVDLQWSFIPEV